MKDAIGQEITIGDSIVHSHADEACLMIHEVQDITEKRVKCEKKGYFGHTSASYFNPKSVVVVTSNLKNL